MSGPSYNFPAQPTYGEGMADAMKAQMEMLTGTGDDFSKIYEEALGREGGSLQDILREFEAPIRQETAQIDTDVLRQTILGGQQKTSEVIKDPESGLYGYYTTDSEGGRNFNALPGQEGGFEPAAGLEVEFPQEKLDAWQAAYDDLLKAKDQRDTKIASLQRERESLQVSPDIFVLKHPRDAARWREIGDEINAASRSYTDQGVKYRLDSKKWQKEYDAVAQTSPTAGKLDEKRSKIVGKMKGIPWKHGQRMPDPTYSQDRLLKGEMTQEEYDKWADGWSKASPEWGELAKQSLDVAKQQQIFKTGDYEVRRDGTIVEKGTLAREAEQKEAAFIAGLPDYVNPLTGEGTDQQVIREGTGMVDLLGDRRAAQQYESKVATQADVDAGRAEAVGDKFVQAVDTGRQAGFDETGNFLGLAALAEDVQRGHMSRQREADLMDVQRLSGQYQDIMEDYRPGTQEALDNARKVLEQRKTDLTGGAITVPTGSTYGGDVDTVTAATAPTLSADTAFGGELAAAGTDPLRQRLLADAKTALGDTLTAREERQIAEAMRGRSTMMGRVFDDSAIHEEAKARLLEDRNRQAMNRAFASQVLGQEAGLQTGDLGRGMQQEGMQADLTQRRDLAQFGADVDRERMEQAQGQQAKQFDVGAKLDAERIGEQLRQSGTLGYIDAATRLAALEDQHTLDPFQAVLGRKGGGSLGAGQSLFGQAGYGLQSGPQYLNPESGLGYISNMAANQASMWGAQQMADASRSRGLMGMFGSGLGALGTWGACWVAREVYGAHNPAWLDFREWMLLRAPSWFRALYIGYGERFAKFISDKPRLKARIRGWMDTKIGRA